jgi:uncharacterized protein YcnI
MFAPARSTRRRATRCALLVTTTVGVLALPTPAQAHVTVQPGQAEGGGFPVVAFRVPNERDNASTTKVQVILPRDQPLGFVQTTPVPGWTVTTASRTLDKPMEMFGAKLDSVVSQVTWTATAGGVRPGQFEDFEVSMGQLPTSGTLVFATTQTYSNGEKVRWNEVAQGEGVEPEHPAPTLEITPAVADSESTADRTSVTAASADTGTPKAATAVSDSSTPVLPTVLSVAALLVALAAAGVAWRRGRS